MRPTIKMFNDAVNSADNWRKNYDRASGEADMWYLKFNRATYQHAYFFMIGIMFGVLGVLLVTQAF